METIAPDLLPAHTDTGSLGIYHMKRFWSRTMLMRQGQIKSPSDEWVLDRLLINGLGLGLHETIRYLFKTGPSFEEFERWVVETNLGKIEPEQIVRINTAVTGKEFGGDQELERSEPVLTSEDFAFWEANGYVVVHDAVPQENCRAAEQAIWEFIKADPEDQTTWYRGPQGHSIMVPLLHHPAFNANRKSLRLRKAFAQIWDRSDIWVNVDRAGFNPPELRNWPFPGPHLHWDTSLEPPIPFGVQGILYLTDTAPDQGAFRLVPGFQHRIEAWLKSLPPDVDPRRDVDLESLGPVPIAGKAGDLVIWREELPHGSSPNRASRPRMVQYITAYPTHWEYNPVWK